MKKLFSLTLLLAAAFTFSACNDDEDKDTAKLTKTDYVMYHEDTQSIEGTDISGIVWDSENEYAATVKDNLITGQYVGKTTVKSANKKLSFTVEVKPKHYTYEEPSLDWGASKSEIKAKYGEPESETEDGLVYTTSNNNAPLMLYLFENGKMTGSSVICKVSAISELTDFLLERYVPINVEASNAATFLHRYGKISNPKFDYGVGMQYHSSYNAITVVYVPNSDSTSRSSDSIDFRAAFQAFGNMLK